MITFSTVQNPIKHRPEDEFHKLMLLNMSTSPPVDRRGDLEPVNLRSLLFSVLYCIKDL